jgi:hypothetical protein
MTTASSVLGATVMKFIPAGGADGAGDVGCPVGLVSVPHAASVEPAPTASTATPAALRAVRRDTASRTRSPKYSFSEVLGAGCEQASPHR